MTCGALFLLKFSLQNFCKHKSYKEYFNHKKQNEVYNKSLERNYEHVKHTEACMKEEKVRRFTYSYSCRETL